MLRIGSMFSGYGGLDLAVEAFYGAETAWYAEKDKHAAAVMEANWPGVPNLGDVTSVEWDTVSPVDIITGGFPCQDISRAGKNAGIKEGTRSGLWFTMHDAIRALRPRLVFVENVAMFRSRGLALVLGQMAEIGYDAEWVSLRADAIGAPHRRERVFVRFQDRRAPDASGQRHGQEQDDRMVGRLGAPPEGGGRTPSAAREVPGDRGQADGVPWGVYADAIARWEPVIGRPAPVPWLVDGNGNTQISDRFVEWMMGLPAGWVSGVLGWSHAHKVLGNGVVPQQAHAALGMLEEMR